MIFHIFPFDSVLLHVTPTLNLSLKSFIRESCFLDLISLQRSCIGNCNGQCYMYHKNRSDTGILNSMASKFFFKTRLTCLTSSAEHRVI